MKSLISTILFISFQATCFGQVADKDKIQQYLSFNHMEDTSLIDPFMKPFRNFLLSNPVTFFKLDTLVRWAVGASQDSTMSDSTISYCTQIIALPFPAGADIYNYKSFASQLLGEIFISKKQYEKALYYLDLNRFVFIPKYDCGNARMDHNGQLRILYASCYAGQGNVNKAIDSLSPFMFDNWIQTKTTIAEKLYETYLKVYSKEEIKHELTNAEKTLHIQKEKWNDHVFYHFTIKIFGRNVELPFSFYNYNIHASTEEQLKQKCIEFYRMSKIYKLANG